LLPAHGQVVGIDFALAYRGTSPYGVVVLQPRVVKLLC
jgi:hypothetical protein